MKCPNCSHNKSTKAPVSQRMFCLNCFYSFNPSEALAIQEGIVKTIIIKYPTETVKNGHSMLVKKEVLSIKNRINKLEKYLETVKIYE